ncbi:MAG: hypothetical protein ABR980_12265 [Ignavibacteriaceae bacterium]
MQDTTFSCFVPDYYLVFRSALNSNLNEVLESELAGYRIINGLITDITSKEEIEMLTELFDDDRFESVN